MTYAAIVVLVLVIPPILFDLVARPGIRRIGLRSVARRPGEASLVIIGSMLATALIVASFVVGDSFRTSYRVRAENRLGPLDMLVLSDDIDADMALLVASLPVNSTLAPSDLAGRADSDELIDDGITIESLLPVVEGELNVANENGKIEPRMGFWEVDPQELKAFGGDIEAAGVVGVPGDLSGTDVVINETLADDLLVSTGDTINVVVGSSVSEYTVVAIVPSWGLAGFVPIIAGPGAFSAAIPNTEGVFRTSIAVSNIGGTYEGRDTTADSERFIRSVLGEDATLTNVKEFTLRRADRIGDNTTSQFSTVGGFSVAAGILLMVNLFVMLAAERKVDLGTMRALGMQRSHTRRVFSVEGLLYGLAATAAGLLDGIAVAWVIIRVSANSFGADDDFQIRLGLEPSSLFSGAVIGLAITQLTVLLTASRVVRINIVSALKDAVDGRTTRQSSLRILIGLVVAGVGLGLWVVGSNNQLLAFIAPILMAVGLVPSLSRLVGQKLAVVAGCGFGIFWSSSVFGLLRETYEDPEIELFLLQGVTLVGLSVTILAAFDRWLMAAIRKLTRGSVASRLGLSSPMARPVRTALLVSMYALVILTVCFTAILNSAFARQTPTYTAQAAGSYDISVRSSTLSPLTDDDLIARSDVDAAVEVVSGVAMIRSPIMDADDEGLEVGDPGAPDPADSVPVRRYISLISEQFVSNGPPELIDRAGRYETDESAWQELASSDSLAIVPVWRGLKVGDRFQIERAQGQPADVGSTAVEVIEVEVIGISDWNWLGGVGLYLSDRQTPALLPEVSPTRHHYLVAADDVDVDRLVDDLEADFAENGTDAESFSGLIEEEAAETKAFIYILQGYLGLGLLIGIAGLCVVLIRGVRERRQQLGMLRAIGFRSELLRTSFLIEAFFIGIQGVALGIGLGTLSAWQVLTRSNAFGEGFDFVVPVWWLVGFAALAMAASMFAGLFPAIRAGRTVPAEALRLPS